MTCQNNSTSAYAPMIPIRSDEDMKPSDMTVDYKVSSFLLLHIDFWYNSLGSTCMCPYLLVDTNVSQSVHQS